MSRRGCIKKRKITPDAKFGSETLAVFINKIMIGGKKSTATTVVYDALDLVHEKTGKDGMEVFNQAMTNCTPLIEVKARRIGGANYQVPVEVRKGRDTALAMRWLIKYSRIRAGKSMAEKLAAELIDASNNVGASVKKREETHKMAEANRAFAHYRW